MSNDSQLITESPKQWSVVTKYHDPKNQTLISHYELHFSGRCQDKRKGAHGEEVLRLTAKHLNRINAVPRSKIMCASDAPNPTRYLQSIAW